MSLFSLAEALYPKTCAGCGALGEIFCGQCQSALVLVHRGSCPFCRRLTERGETCSRCGRKSALRGAFVAARLEPRLRGAIHALKFRHGRRLADELAPYLAARIRGNAGGFTNVTLVPIPADPVRARSRLFNSAELIAAALGRELGWPVARLLTKKRSTAPQSHLKRSERLANLAGAFAATDKTKLNGASVILVDDVATTYSTLSAAASVVRQLEPRRIWAAVIAHGEAAPILSIGKSRDLTSGQT